MEPTLLSDSPFTLEQQNILLGIARDAILYGLKHNHPMPVESDNFPSPLSKQGASFVTLNIDQALRGCIGTLESYQPLVKDVAQNAFAAAFTDPRFPPLCSEEYEKLDIHISVLNPAEEINFSSEQDLISQLRPNIDGLILIDGHSRGTFLPSVWQQLPTPEVFLEHLKQKAGLPADYWSSSIRVERYTTSSFPD